jgi:hypothetical protein
VAGIHHAGQRRPSGESLTRLGDIPDTRAGTERG